MIDCRDRPSQACVTIYKPPPPLAPLPPIYYYFELPPNETTISPPVGLLDNTTSPDPNCPVNMSSTLPTVAISAGSVTISFNGFYTVVLPANFYGNATFCAGVRDCRGRTGEACATIYKPPPPLAPLPPIYYYFELPPNETTISPPVGLLDNTTSPDPNCPVNMSSTLPTVAISAGSVTISFNGFYTVVLPANFYGNATFCAGVRDCRGRIGEACATIYRPPPTVVYQIVARNDTYTGTYNTPFTLALPSTILLNDDSSSPTKQLEVTTGPSPALVRGSGNVTNLTPQGTFTFTPANGFAETAVFPYSIIDRSTGQTASAFVHIVFEPPQPTAQPDVFRCPFNLVCRPGVSILQNDTSAAGGTLKVESIVTPPPLGALVWQPDGKFEYTPAT